MRKGFGQSSFESTVGVADGLTRYVRFRNSQSGNLTEIEFRVRKDKKGLTLFIK